MTEIPGGRRSSSQPFVMRGTLPNSKIALVYHFFDVVDNETICIQPRCDYRTKDKQSSNIEKHLRCRHPLALAHLHKLKEERVSATNTANFTAAAPTRRARSAIALRQSSAILIGHCQIRADHHTRR